MPELHDVPLDSAAWGWKPGDVTTSEFQGRPCITFGESVDLLAPVVGVELTDGVIEIDMALTGARAFHGVAWRVLDDDNYESFYVRPHQVGNPDSVQYNPVFNGVAGHLAARVLLSSRCPSGSRYKGSVGGADLPA
jgi:hypothetical protein